MENETRQVGQAKKIPIKLEEAPAEDRYDLMARVGIMSKGDAEHLQRLDEGNLIFYARKTAEFLYRAYDALCSFSERIFPIDEEKAHERYRKQGCFIDANED